MVEIEKNNFQWS